MTYGTMLKNQVLVYYIALQKDAKVPVEMHLYAPAGNCVWGLRAATDASDNGVGWAFRSWWQGRWWDDRQCSENDSIH